MSNPQIGFSHLTGRIYAFSRGRFIPGRHSDALVKGTKNDVTADAIIAVGLHMLHGLPEGCTGSDCTFDYDGKVYRLAVLPAETEEDGQI